MDKIWNQDAAAEFYAHGYWADRTIYDLFTRQVASRRDAEALVDDYRRITYADLKDEVELCAAILRANGVQPGDVVTIQTPNRIEFVTVMLALELVGAIANNVSTDYRSTELTYILNYSKSKAYICADVFRGFSYLNMVKEIRAIVPTLELVISISGSGSPDDAVFLPEALTAAAPLPATEWTRPRPDDVMRLAFTSGTTGDPKGVMHSHNTTIFPMLTMNRGMRIDETSTQMIFMPVTLNTGYLSLLQTLLAGARGVLVEHFAVDQALETIARERVTAFSTPPAALVMMLDSPRMATTDISSLRVIKSGGAPASLELLRRIEEQLDARLIESYGMLETGFHCHTRVEDDAVEAAGTVGRPVEGMGLSIRGSDDVEVAQGEEGELLARGPGVHLGYIDNAAANAASFTCDGWFVTGDLGRLDLNGRLVISGRKKEIINRAGKKYFPREIEEILLTHPKIHDVTIVGLPDRRTGERSCACVVTRPGEEITLEEIVGFLENKVARYKLPEKLVLFSSFPRTATGKTRRLALIEQIMTQEVA